MSLFGNIREASLSFVSEGKTYTLLEPWTTELVLELSDRPLVIRKLLGDQYVEWRKTHKTRKQMEQLTKDSLATIGCNGEHVYQMLSVLEDDKLFPFLEGDLNAAGIRIDDVLDGSVPIRRMVSVFAGLGRDSAWQRELNKPHSDWGTAEYMLAEICDLLNFQVQLQHVTAQVGGWQPKGKTRPPKPMFLRPGEEREKPKMNPTSDLIMMMKARRGGQG